jgi:hypothetical protein
MLQRHCIYCLVFEGVEKDLNYILGSSDMILHSIFVKLLLEREVG